ncbi:MAG: hypothetical protein GXO64_04195 [Candidatus Micrarchaeota archaeon]|nr:hypothetical protein [Candidatus Micrarchaeota archaeon]
MSSFVRVSFALVLVVVILMSGCSDIPFLSGFLGGTEVKQFEHDIIIIKDVRVTPAPSLRPGQYINLHVYIKNLQKIGADAKKVKITLYDTCEILKPVKSGSVCPGSKMTGNERICTIDKMYPQSEQEVVWRLRAVDLKVEQTCNVGIQVEYDHETKTISSVEFASQSEIENLVQQGKGKTSIGRMTVGEGPVKLYISIPGQPLMVGDEPVEKGVGVIEFWVENKGSGILKDNKVKRFVIENLATKGTEIIKFKRNATLNAVKKIDTNDEDIKKDITLTMIGRSTPKNTWLIVPNDNLLKDKIFATLQLVGTVEYSYKFTKTIGITVTPIL